MKPIKDQNIPVSLSRLLHYAAMAPSSHNSQPWRVRISSPDQFIVQSDSSRWLPKVDPANREVLLSIGAFWENLEQAASVFGFKVNAAVLADNTTAEDILEIRLVKSTRQDDNRLHFMEYRSTHRLECEREELNLSHLRACERLLSTSLYYFSRDGSVGKWMARELPRALEKQVFNDEKQRELVEWLRFSRSHTRRSRDGITAGMLGLSPVMKFLWFAFMNPASARSKSFRDGVVQSLEKKVNACAGFFVITSDDFSVSSLLQAGREFQRLALKCTELGIEVQPLSQLIREYPWKEELKQIIGMGKPVQCVLCVGYSPKHFKQGPRRPVSDFTINGDTPQIT
jgi:nitroreductase